MRAADVRVPGIPRWILVVLVSALAQFPTFNRSLVPLDEGQIAATGTRLLGGEILYGDIYTGIFPGVYWLSAALFHAFGNDIVVLRAAQVVVNALTAGALYRLVQPMVPGALAWAAPLGYAVLNALSFPVLTMLSYSSLALLAALSALLAARRFVGNGHPGWGVLTGVALACCVLFKQNYGALALLSMMFSALWTRSEGALGARSKWFAMAWPIAGGTVVAATAGSLIALSGAWSAFLDATLFTLFQTQMTAFHQPLPPVFGPHPTGDAVFLFLYSPSGLLGAMLNGQSWISPALLTLGTRLGYGSAYVALLALPFLARRFDSTSPPDARVTARLVLPFAGVFFFGIFPSAIWSHLAAVYPPLLIVHTSVAAAGWSVIRSRSRGVSIAAGAMVTACTVAAGAAAVAVSINVHRSYGSATGLPSNSLLVSQRDATLYRAAVRFLRECAPMGSPVFVIPDMPLLYITSARHNPTPYDIVIPGNVQEEFLVERLNSERVNCIVFNPAMYLQFEPFERLFPRLNAYMAEEFTTTGSVVTEGTTWRFLERRRAAP